MKINEYQKNQFVRNMLNTMFNTLSGKRISLFGFAFKANTGDTWETLAIAIARKLLQEHTQVMITDPQALRNARLDLAGEERTVIYEKHPYKAAEGCHVIAVITE